MKWTDDMISIEELLVIEKKNRSLFNPNKACHYGIKCLDDAMPYIMPDDFNVIGADSGVGKTELALHIAKHNAKNGKNVYVFSLEEGEEGAIRRILWKDICKQFYSQVQHEYLSYEAWVTNNLNSEKVDDLEKAISLEYQKTYGGRLHFYVKSNNINADSVFNSLMNFWSGEEFNKKTMFNVDLIIIDHLHYFNLEDNAKSNEASKITEILKKIKEIPQFHHIPVVLFSHLRKKTRDRCITDQEDFHGSSNIPKISSNSIIISPMASNDHNIFPTIFRFVKSRYGLKSNYAACCNFNLKLRQYEETYQIYGIDGFNKLSNTPWLAEKWPRWSKQMSKTLLPIQEQKEFKQYADWEE